VTSRDAILRVLGALKETGKAHLVTGALASNYYGIERSTKDADIVLETAPEDFTAFAKLLGSELKLDPQVSFETITGSLRHIITVAGTDFQIELFLLGSDRHHQERFARRRPACLKGLGADTWIPTAEDVVIQKVRWGRLKDLDDALNVLAVQGDALDFAYIESWCREHGTLERLNDLRRSVPPV